MQFSRTRHKNQLRGQGHTTAHYCDHPAASCRVEGQGRSAEVPKCCGGSFAPNSQALSSVWWPACRAKSERSCGYSGELAFKLWVRFVVWFPVQSRATPRVTSSLLTYKYALSFYFLFSPFKIFFLKRNFQEQWSYTNSRAVYPYLWAHSGSHILSLKNKKKKQTSSNVLVCFLQKPQLLVFFLIFFFFF